MDRNDIRAVLLAYHNLEYALKQRGYTMVDMEGLIENIEKMINQHPESYYSGPDLRRK